MANAVMEGHHSLQQNVGQTSSVLKLLIDVKRFDVDAPENLLFIPRDEAIAKATGTVRHAGNHEPVEAAQRAILDDFGRTPTQYGKSYETLMRANPATLSAAEQTLRAQIYDQAEILAKDLRDYTSKSMIDGRLTLTKTDPKYAGLSAAAADAAWRADVAQVFGNGPNGFDTGRQNLSAYRAETAAIKAAHGDLRWRAFNSQAKIDTLLATAAANNTPLFGTKAKLADLNTLIESKGFTVPKPATPRQQAAAYARQRAIASSQQQMLTSVAKAQDMASLGRGVLSVGGKAFDRAIATTDVFVNYTQARQAGQTVLEADAVAGKQLLHDVAVGLLVVGGTVALTAAGVPTLAAGAIVAGVTLVGAVADSAWDYVGAPLAAMAGSLSDADFAAAQADLEAVAAGIATWTNEVVIPFLRTVQFNATAFAQDPQGYLKSLGQAIWDSTRQGLLERWEAGGVFVGENLDALGNAVQYGFVAALGGEVRGAVAGFGNNGASIDATVQGMATGVTNVLNPPTAPGRRNDIILDVATDTVGMLPPRTDLGSTGGGHGLLHAGAGYTATMADRYVTRDGIEFVAPSNIVTGGTRPGNLSLNDLSGLLAGVRSQAHQQNLLVERDGQLLLIKGPSAAVPDVVEFRGMRFEAITYYDSQGRWIGFTPKAGQAGRVRMHDGTEISLDPSQTILVGENTLSNGKLTAFGWVPMSTAAMAAYLEAQVEAGVIPYTDPLALDAGNDGVNLGAVQVDFDLDADGRPERTRWTSPTDPLLVMDRNFDGRISSGAELFTLTEGAGARPTLASLDSNQDGKLDAEDTHWAHLRVWVDRNQDAYASAGELTSLADLGIQSINLTPVTGSVAGQSNVKGVVATYANGATRTLWDVALNTPGAGAAPSPQRYSAEVDKVMLGG
ncbi:AHH domain-containing protein, partial [Achromobacter sp. Marseille-Q0513]|uniref:AHH domain-containing protein n=1 Tax=Achromobacter sp. Marseille-Q0513 TaxID=2829161 RepID=UPI001B9ED67D